MNKSLMICLRIHIRLGLYGFVLLQLETDSGTLIPEVSGYLQYRVTKDAIGKFISFKCTPVRDDETVGEPRSCVGQERVRPGECLLINSYRSLTNILKKIRCTCIFLCFQ